MHLESLQIEVEMLGKQKGTVEGEQHSSGLFSEIRNLQHNENRKQTRLESFHCQVPRALQPDKGPGRAGGGTDLTGSAKCTTREFAWAHTGLCVTYACQ